MPHFAVSHISLVWLCCHDDDSIAQAVVNCAREMENFFEREGAHGAAAIPYLRVEVDDKARRACFGVAISNRRI